MPNSSTARYWIAVSKFIREAIVFAADPIMWKSQDPVWVEQWLLPKEKLLAAKALIFEQVQLGLIEPSNSPWNTPIFVIKKTSGNWRLLQDLRAINVHPLDHGKSKSVPEKHLFLLY